MVYYTANQVATLTSIIITGSVLSVIGSLFIVLNFCIFKSLRNNFAFKLLLWVAITDLIDGVGSIVPTDEAGFGCTLQAMTKQFGDNASLCWVVAISWTIYHITKLTKVPTKKELNNLLKKMHIVIWILAVITTILPLTTNSYGVAGGWCWIKKEKSIDSVWRYTTFFIPLWMSIIYMIYIYIRVWNKLRPVAEAVNLKQQINQVNQTSTVDVTVTVTPDQENVTATNENENENEEETQVTNEKRKNHTLQRMKYYPMILIICYFFASIRRITDDIVDGHAPYALAVLHFIFEPLIGFCDGIAYGLTPEIRKMDAELLRNLCGSGCKKGNVEFREQETETHDDIR